MRINAFLATSPPVLCVVCALLTTATAEEHLLICKPKTIEGPIAAERVDIGQYYKPCVARLPSGELLLCCMKSHTLPQGKLREEIILFRSQDGGRTWSAPEVLDLLGREPYFSTTTDGRLLMTAHLLTQDVRNKLGYTYSYLHRSTDGGRNWKSLAIKAEDIPGADANSWTLTSRNVLELSDGSLILGVSADSSIDFLWRSRDGGKTWDKSRKCTVQGFDVTKQGFPWHAETVFFQARNDDLLAVARCFPGALPPLSEAEVPGGTDHVERMALFRSSDGGKTWTLEPELGNYYGEMYPSILRLQDGRLLLTFTMRSAVPPQVPPLGVQAVLGVETKDGFEFDFRHDRIMLDTKTPVDQASGGGFGPTVQLDDGTLVTSYSYAGPGEWGTDFHVEVVRWRLPPRKP